MVQRKFKLKIKQVIKPICDLRLKPESNSNLETQLLFGEKIKIINNNFYKSIIHIESVTKATA